MQFLLMLAICGINEPPADCPPVERTTTIMVGCETGKCTPVRVPVGSVQSQSGAILVPAYVDARGVQVYRELAGTAKQTVSSCPTCPR
jgi:hypothetical protein